MRPFALEVAVGTAQRRQPPRAGDDEEDAARRFALVEEFHLGAPVGEQLLGQPLLRFGCAVPLEVARDRACRRLQVEAGVRQYPAPPPLAQVVGRLRGRPPLAEAEARVGERGTDQIGDEPIRLQLMGELGV
jgi:hypothetical protein